MPTNDEMIALFYTLSTPRSNAPFDIVHRTAPDSRFQMHQCPTASRFSQQPGGLPLVPCHIVKNGVESCTVYDMDGPKLMKSQKYRCDVHADKFGVWNASALEQCDFRQFRPNVWVFKRNKTLLTQELLWDVIVMWRRTYSVSAIVNGIQQRWKGIWKFRCKDNADTNLPASEAADPDNPWWTTASGQDKFTDKRTMIELLGDIYRTFFRSTALHDFGVLRSLFTVGVGIDETFKIQGKVRVMQRKDNGDKQYNEASFCLHTLVSLQTGQVCGLKWLPDTKADSKAVILQELFERQVQNGDVSRQCRYVVTDNGAGDESMVQKVGFDARMQQTVLVGDDAWHSRGRIFDKMPSTKFPKDHAASVDLMQAYGLLERRDTTVASFQQALDAWLTKHDNELPQAAKNVARTQRTKARYFVAWQQLLPLRLAFKGTLPNERWHNVLKKMFPHASHVRPDHASILMEWAAYEWNCQVKETARSSKWYEHASVADQQEFDKLFQLWDYLPVENNSNRCWHLLVETSSERVLTQEDVEKDFFCHDAL